MSRTFVACKGKTACQENDTHCITCGRSLDEIYATRDLVEALVEFSEKMRYQNSDMFFEYVVNKASKKLAYIQKQADETENI
jgi:hypothetical protein